jgi:hypothetical protein
MKSYATFIVIALMSMTLVFLLLTREHIKRDAPAEVVDVGALDGGADGASPADAGAVATVDAGTPPRPAEKPLRVVTLGWELAAAGAAIPPAAGGSSTSSVELAPETTLDAIEARLARGGADPQGADVAIMPLPAFVVSYEKLRALEPRAFLVVGFSHGREEVHAAPGALLKAPAAADEVKLVAVGASAAAEARPYGSESATVLGLFALDELGIAPSRVRFVDPGTPDAKGAPFAAIVRGAVDERKLAFSTADASRLVPIVAVGSKGLLDSREAVVRAWSTSWLDGLSRAAKDVPGIARRLAAKEALPLSAGVGGAPEALVLVERLGQIENMTLAEQTSLIGPLAKGAVTLDTLTQRTWQLARGGGLTAAAAPDPLPVDARVVSMIAPPPKDAPRAPAEAGDAGATFGAVPAGSVPLFAYRATDGDAEKVAGQIAFLAGAFERAVFKVSAKGGEKAARALATAAKDHGVAAMRLATGAAEPTAFASVDVLALP